MSGLGDDPSHGYDAVADAFADIRSDSGVDIVVGWAKRLHDGASVIDIGAGTGLPLTAALLDLGLDVHAVDASVRMVARFRRRFPDVPIRCEAGEASTLFDRRFDAALCIGVLFLLPEKSQSALIGNIAKALEPGGSLLASVPRQACEWKDALTGRMSRSLGLSAYSRIFADVRLGITDTHRDGGGSYYIEALKT